MYYAGIGYFPQIKWDESLSYLGVMAILGSFFVVLYAALLYVPGRIWCRFLICDLYLKEALSYDAERERPCLKSVLRIIVLPFAMYSVVLHVLLLVAAALAPQVDLYGGLFVAALLGLLVPASHFYKRISPGMLTDRAISLQGRDFDRHRLTLAVFFFLSLLSSFVAVWTINRIDVSRVAGLTPDFILLAAVCTSVVLCVNFFVAITHKTDPRAARAAAVLGAFTLLICGDLLVQEPSARLSARTLSNYGIGYDQQATLVVKERACQILNAQALEDKLTCEKDVSAKVENVKILSGLGSEYFLWVNGRKVALPKEDVLSWSVSDLSKK